MQGGDGGAHAVQEGQGVLMCEVFRGNLKVGVGGEGWDEGHDMQGEDGGVRAVQDGQGAECSGDDAEWAVRRGPEDAVLNSPWEENAGTVVGQSCRVRSAGGQDRCGGGRRGGGTMQNGGPVS